MRFLLLAAVLLAAAPASAQRGRFVLPDIPENLARWVLVSTSGFDDTYIDRDTIEREGQIVKVWEWIAFKAVRPATDTFPETDRSSMLVRYDCQRRTAQILYAAAYRRGVIVESSDMDADEFPVDAWMPESADEIKGRYVCAS